MKACSDMEFYHATSTDVSRPGFTFPSHNHLQPALPRLPVPACRTARKFLSPPTLSSASTTQPGSAVPCQFRNFWANSSPGGRMLMTLAKLYGTVKWLGTMVAGIAVLWVVVGLYMGFVQDIWPWNSCLWPSSYVFFAGQCN